MNLLNFEEVFTTNLTIIVLLNGNLNSKADAEPSLAWLKRVLLERINLKIERAR